MYFLIIWPTIILQTFKFQRNPYQNFRKFFLHYSLSERLQSLMAYRLSLWEPENFVWASDILTFRLMFLFLWFTYLLLKTDSRPTILPSKCFCKIWTSAYSSFALICMLKLSLIPMIHLCCKSRKSNTPFFIRTSKIFEALGYS